MAAEGADIIRYVITGEDDEEIPRNATHFSVHPSVKVIPAHLLYNTNIVELICHDGVIKIGYEACGDCFFLKRLIMKGVEEIEENAFFSTGLEYVECDKLEIIGTYAFGQCKFIININLPSAKIVFSEAFCGCDKLQYVKFGKKLESFEEGAFYDCRSLKRITIPLKNGLIQHDNTFQMCGNLTRVDFVEGVVLQETIDALLCDTWRNDMVVEIDSINQILPNAYAGHQLARSMLPPEKVECDDPGEKAQVIRNGIANMLRKINHYKSQHRRLIKEAACRLQLSLPHDIVMNNVIPFLMLPQHTFDGEIEGEDEEHVMNCDDADVVESHTSRLSDEKEVDANEGSWGEDADDDVIGEACEACEDVTGDGESEEKEEKDNKR